MHTATDQLTTHLLVVINRDWFKRLTIVMYGIIVRNGSVRRRQEGVVNKLACMEPNKIEDQL
jgi:hypothetical protein